MSFATDGISREAIQALQFELWPDCKSGCSFCYLNGTKRTTSLQEKINNIKDALKTLQDEDIIKDYNAVGLIGGEFFQGQLRSLETEWYSLIEYLRMLLDTRKMKEIWLATSLINIIEGDLIGTLYILSQANLTEGQRVTVCTSFDTLGRFNYNFEGMTQEEIDRAAAKGIYPGMMDPDKLNPWLDEIKFIRENYPNVVIHVQIILTQDVIDKLIENPDYFDFLTDLGCIIDFRYPSITRADCPSATVIEDYRSLLLAKYKDFPEKFFIENRASFLKFLSVYMEKFGIEKVKNLLHQPEMRSRRLKIYVDNVDIEDRWNDERDRYLDCGHLIDGLCYIDSDKCIYCDIEKFLETQENA